MPTRLGSGRARRESGWSRSTFSPAQRLAAAAVEALETRRLLAPFAVTTTTDGGAGSLRQAIIDANANPGPDDITVPAGTYELAILGTGEDEAETGDLDVTDDLTITATGGVAFILANEIDRVFHILPPPQSIDAPVVRFTGLDISEGATDGEGGGINTDGGAALTLTNCNLHGNTAFQDGGAIEAEGDLTVLNSTIQRNQTHMFGDGGGINLNDIGKLTLTDSTIDDNTAAGRGGGIRTSNDLEITRSTISNNDASNGGGLWTKQALVTITNSTFSGNFTAGDSGQGGGIFFRNLELDATLINVTVTDNSAGQGGGIYVEPGEHAPTLVNTIVAANNLLDSQPDTAGADVNGAFTSGGHNLIGIGDGSTGLTDDVNDDQVGSAANPILPLLEPLGDNTGPTFTHALLPDSPAIDAADLDTAPDDDQRGVERPQGAAPDIGAFELEVQGCGPAVIRLGDDPARPGRTALLIEGTCGEDYFDIDPSRDARGRFNGRGVDVFLNEQFMDFFDFDDFGNVFIYTKEGNDKVAYSHGVFVGAFIFGGDGDDHLRGGGGWDVIVGGPGLDTCDGRGSRDIAIGGDDADNVVDTNGGEDLLIAGITDHDANETALFKLRSEWVSSRSYNSRRTNLLNGTGSTGGFRLNDTTVLDDDATDLVTGGSGRDLFYANRDTGTGQVKDNVTDKKSDETVVDID